MKILLTHRFFWPDTVPYATMLRSIGDALAEAGNDVHLLSSIPSYRSAALADAVPQRERLGALNVRRVWVFSHEKRNPLRRFANVILYCWALFFTALRLRPDVITASTFPPVIAAWSASLAARLVRARFVYHIQDIHPELSIQSGGWLGGALPVRLMRWLDNQTLRRSDAIVTLSEDMAATLRRRGGSNLPIRIINNPPLKTDAPVALSDDFLKAPGTVRLIFAGNLGRFQNLELLTEGVALCFDAFPNLELMYLGDGAALADLKKHWGHHSQVRFVPFMPFDTASAIIGTADIGLVSLNPGIYQVSYPSKVSTYFDLGLRVLALVEPESCLAQDLEHSGRGTVPEAATPTAIAAALHRLLAQSQRFCDQVSDDHYLEAWVSIFKDLAKPRSKAVCSG